jgi:hypothetical protein
MKNARQIIAASLLVGGALQVAAPVFAEGTTAGTTISNTANATYNDPDGNTINSTSNKVDIKVAEVAGIDVSSNNTPTSAAPLGTINYDFVVTNTGNDPTKLVLPGTASLTGPGTVTQVIYSTDPTFATSTDITSTTAQTTTSSVAADGKLYVRVVVTVNSGASTGSTISVEYGKSATPANSNQDYVANGVLDAKTVDNADGTATNEVDGAPVNGVREDSAVASATVADAPAVLNGPNTKPDATGTDGTTRTDFTNKTTPIDPNTAPGTTTLDPAVFTFTNTIQNTGNGSNPYTIIPTTATGILVAGGNLPVDTEVTITDANDATKTATYKWDGNTFTKISGTDVVITVASGGTANYTVKVDLPLGTKLSTDMTTPGDFTTAVGGFPVPIVAYIEDATPGFGGTEVNNITTDRLYTGYMAMYKEAQICKDSGCTTGNVVQAWTTNTTLLTAAARPTYYIKYRISYKNISTDPAGSTNSVSLTANGFKIIEDGLTSPNNWAKDNDTNGKIDTSSVNGTTSGAGTIAYFNNSPAVAGTDKDGDGTAANEVTKYENTVGNVAPSAAAGTFQFVRKIN